ncbi:MAG: M16 family metallopeptidase [Gemmatimonadaceae bacterium]
MLRWLDALASTERVRLPNGLTVLVRHDASAPVAAVVTHVNTGYFDETDDVGGIAHVLEHMYFKGTPTRGVGEIAKATKANGGYLNAATIYDYTVYYAVLPKDGFLKGLEIQADAFANALIDSAELARELEVIVEEAKRKADNPGAVATESLYALMHDRHRIRRWRIGHEETLRGLTRDHLLRFYSNFYRPGNTILALVGDFDVDRVLRCVETLYGGLASGVPLRTPGPNETAPSGFRYRELHGDIAQTHVALGWRTAAALHADTPLLDVAGAALALGRSSRLYRAVRERKLASSVTAYNYTPTEIGVFGAEAEGPPERAREAAAAMWSEITALGATAPAPAELERVRRVTAARWVRRLETMDGQATFLAEWEALGDWRLSADYYERFMSAAPRDVLAVASRYLVPDQAALLVYRPSAASVFAADAAAAREWLEQPRERVAPAAVPPAVRVPGPAQPARMPSAEHGIALFRTAAGVPLLVKQRPETPLVHLGLFTLGGAAAEASSQLGVTTLTMRAALKGTAELTADAIAEVSESLGGSIVPSVASESAGWTLSVPVEQFADAAALLAHVTQEPIFPAAAIETERAVALSQLEQARDDMMRYPIRLALAAAFREHPYARVALGDEETLLTITQDQVVACHAQRVLNGASVLAIAGDVEPQHAADILATAFARLTLAPATTVAPPAWPLGARSNVELRAKAQTGLAMLLPGPTRRSVQRHTAEVLTSVASGLGGRFFEELRDRRSLAYTVHVSSIQRREAGAILAYLGTSPEKETAAREALLGEFARLRESDVTEEELERAQNYIIGSHAIARQSGAAVLAEIVDAWLLGTGLRELDEFESAIRSVAARDIRALAQEAFDPERRVEGVVRGGGVRGPP